MPSLRAKSNDNGGGQYKGTFSSSSSSSTSLPCFISYRSTIPLAISLHDDGPNPQTLNRIEGGHCRLSERSRRNALFIVLTPEDAALLPPLTRPRLFQPKSRLCIETNARGDLSLFPI